MGLISEDPGHSGSLSLAASRTQKNCMCGGGGGVCVCGGESRSPDFFLTDINCAFKMEDLMVIIKKKSPVFILY